MTTRGVQFALCCVFAAVGGSADAIVIEPGVPDACYLASAEEIPVLADLPGEGHGVLIDPKWVITAAHAMQGYDLDQVKIGGKWRPVSRVVVYPGVTQQLAEVRAAAAHPTAATKAALTAKLAAVDDIALIELSSPVEDIAPLPIYRNQDEEGRIAKLYGRGATGNGLSGQDTESPHRGKLRRAANRISEAQGRWLTYAFDCGSTALPLEGVLGDGDSGGPVLIEIDGEWMLAGLAGWKHWPPHSTIFRAGVCGQHFSNVRLSHYAQWIDSVIGAAVRP